VVSVPIDAAEIAPIVNLPIERIVFQVPSAARDEMLRILDRCAATARQLGA